jgi:NAD(P)-dependent dehydrogenase (short-subunit alcohol dehydrogenase family)
MTDVALVTGGDRGIGRGIALELARCGIDVAIGYRRDEVAAKAVAQELTALGRRGVPVQGNVAGVGEGERLVAETVAAFGRIDVLVSNAGVLANVAFLDTTPEQYEEQLAVNAQGSFFLVQAAAKQMIEQGRGGRIVLVTSEAADKPVPGLAAYCVSKAAQKMTMKVAAVELAAHGIRVNAVAPGTIETDINRDMLSDQGMREALLADVLVGRPGAPADVAAAVAYLVSHGAGHVVGSTVSVNGGSLIV